MKKGADTQLELLEADLTETQRLINENIEVFRVLGDLTDLTHQNYLSVVVDLRWRVLYHVLGVRELIKEKLWDPLIVVQRAIFETIATLSYLTRLPNSEEEALVLRAYTQLKQLKIFSDQSEIVDDRRQLLSRMPPKAVAVAKKRLQTKPYTWSGMTIRQMAEIGKITGYFTMYDYLSAEAHASIIGEHVQIIDHGNGIATIEFGREIPSRDIEAHANYARRAIKHSFRIMWNIFNGPTVQILTPDPDEWEKFLSDAVN